MKSHQLQTGFTLVELLIAMVIIGILSVLGISNFMSSQMKARDTHRKSDLQSLSKSLEMYYNDKGKYPDALGGLIVNPQTGAGIPWGSEAGLTDTTVSGGAVYMVKMPKDPSSGAYFYVNVANGTGYRLYARLENTKDAAAVKDVDNNPAVYPGVVCGALECNYEIVSSNLQL